MFCSCIYITTSFLPYIVQYSLRLRGQGKKNCIAMSCCLCWCIITKRSSFEILFSRSEQLLFHSFFFFFFFWLSTLCVVIRTSALEILSAYSSDIITASIDVFSALNSESFNMALMWKGLCILYMIRSKDKKKNVPKERIYDYTTDIQRQPKI